VHCCIGRHDGHSGGEILGIITVFFANLLAVLFFYVYSAEDPAILDFDPGAIYEPVIMDPEEARQAESAAGRSGAPSGSRTVSAASEALKEEEELREAQGSAAVERGGAQRTKPGV